MCRWIEENCVYGEGDWEGEAVRLRPPQRRFIWRLYEYWPETGLRRYKRAGLGMAKGSGKTPLAGFIGAYELLGAGRRSPRVMVGAASLKQADLVFGDMDAAITHEESPLSDFVEPYDLRILVRDEPGLAERIAAVAATNDGARATCFIADELHEWVGPLERVHMVAEGALGKRRDSLSLWISTAGWRKESLLGRYYDYGVKLAKGELVDDETLFEWYEAPEHLDLDDPDQWLEAVTAANPHLGDFASLDFVRARFNGALAIPRHEFERYHTNRWTGSPEEWLPAGAWEGLAVAQSPPAGARVWLAFKGSYSNDAAALVGCTETGQVFVVDTWEADPDHPYVVPRSELDAAVDRAMRTWKVQRLGAHPQGFDADIERWADAYNGRHEEPVVLWDIRRRKAFADASSKFYTAVVNRAVSHDGNPVLARHLKDATVKRSVDGDVIVAQGVDAAVAAVMARDMAGVRPRPRRLISF